jgi:hypothetical protein
LKSIKRYFYKVTQRKYKIINKSLLLQNFNIKFNNNSLKNIKKNLNFLKQRLPNLKNLNNYNRKGFKKIYHNIFSKPLNFFIKRKFKKTKGF